MPTFQSPLFTLILYGLKCKELILWSSRFKVKGKRAASDIANGLIFLDLQRTAAQWRQGNYSGGTQVSRKFLSAVDACAASLPHTREAAKKARAKAETLQHHFGIGAIFLTLTFDDENSLLMQIFHGEIIDDLDDVSGLSDEELAHRSYRREQLRINYPGLAALNFKMLLEVIFQEVVGWDIRTKKPTNEPGYFGKCEAFTFSVEEQGRKTLHVHCILWIEGYQKMLDDTLFGAQEKQRTAKAKAAQFYNHTSTTSLFAGIPTWQLSEIFNHECADGKMSHLADGPTSTVVPKLCSTQQLCNLRHQQGYKETDSYVAHCPQGIMSEEIHL
jgi:hypothetical protein